MSECVAKLDYFCYICGKFIVKGSDKCISDIVRVAYEQYFNLHIENVSWAPSKICRSCYNRLKEWWNGKLDKMPFGVPMIWSDMGTHNSSNCYVCANFTTGLNKSKIRNKIYKAVMSAQTPLPHSSVVPVPKAPMIDAHTVLTERTAGEPGMCDPMYDPPKGEKTIAPISQQLMNSIVAKLELSQRKAEQLASMLNTGNNLAEGVKVTGYRHRQASFQKFFIVNSSNTFAYCNDITGLMKEIGIAYNPRKWRLFIDSSKSGLKVVLLYYTNKKPSIPIAYSTSMKETYDTMKIILDTIGYTDNNWRISCDLKVIALLCGLQTGYTKHMCFICLWNTRYDGDQYEKRDWPKRENVIIGRDNVIRPPLVPTENIMLPPLHIKLGIVKNFVKKLDRDGPAYKYLQEIFPKLSESKIKEGVFNGPDIRKLMTDPGFHKCLNENAMIAWDAIKAVINNFLGKHRAKNYHILISDMLEAFKRMQVSMSLKIHFLHSHLDYFERQLASESDEHGERFHQVAMPMEIRYKGKKLDAMLGDICWWLKNMHQNNDTDESSSSDNSDANDDGTQRFKKF